MSRSSLTLIATALLAASASLPALALDIQPRGRIHLDYATHDQDRQPLGDGFRVRRARLGLAGRIDDSWQFLIEYDFAENTTTANDVFIRYTGWTHGQLTIGHFKVPFSLDELVGSNTMPFIERALPTTTFAQSRRLGVGYDLNLDRMTFAVMGFGQAAGSGVRSSRADEGLGLGARVTFNPIRAEGHLLHLGVAASREQPEDRDLEQVRFRTRPESRPSDVRLVDTGIIDQARWITQLGAEAAWQSGPLTVQGEWMGASIERRNGLPGLDFDGWYLSGSWFLTGESRSYRNGVFGGIVPQGRRGAWELLARYSHVNLDDGVIAGGRQSNRSLGLNWYANNRIRIMASFIDVRSRRSGQSDDPGIFLLRAQAAF